MSEDKKAAEAQVDREREQLRQISEAERAKGCRMEIFDPRATEWPAGDGTDMVVNFSIGYRGALTKQEAKRIAGIWRKSTERYPNAAFTLSMMGYDNDPRELYEFPEVTRYVRRWARYTGMDNLAVADRWIGPSSVGFKVLVKLGMPGLNGFSFLAGCGVFGKDFQQAARRHLKPTIKQ